MQRERTDFETLARPMMEALAADDPDRASGNNSVGFSGADTNAGHDLVNQDYPWTPAQCDLAYKILRRYKNTQLPRLGFTFDSLPDPDADGSVTAYREARRRQKQGSETINGRTYYRTDRPVTADRPTSRMQYAETESTSVSAAPATVTVDKDQVTIGWEFDRTAFYDRLHAVKAVPGARFNPKGKTWTVAVGPHSAEAITALMDTLERIGNVTGTDAARAAVTAIQDQAAANLDASRAMAAELDVAGITDPSVLRPFQRAGVAYATEHRHTIIADDMGLGKTLEALATVVHNDCDRVLIVAPASLKLNWQREITKWVHGDTTTYVVRGTTPEPLDMSRFTVVNYDILTQWKDELASQKWDAVIADECHYLKNWKANRSRAFASIVKAANPRFLLMLTGTPMLNRPIELFPILKMIGGDRKVGGWKHYTERYCAAHDNGFGMDYSGAANLNELNTILRSSGLMIRRRKTDVLPELPNRQWAPVPVMIADRYVKRYDELVRHAAAATDPGAALQLIGNLRVLMAQAKMDAARKWIEQFLESSAEKIVVMAWHRSVTVDLAKYFDAPMIIGGMSQSTVEAGKERFQSDPACRVIVCNIASGGVGHTLTAASNVVFVESAWNAALMDQALDRVHRIGQTADSVTGWILAGTRADGEDTIDDYMADMIANKRAITEEGTDGRGVSSQRSIIARWVRRVADQDARIAAESEGE